MVTHMLRIPLNCESSSLGHQHSVHDHRTRWGVWRCREHGLRDRIRPAALRLGPVPLPVQAWPPHCRASCCVAVCYEAGSKWLMKEKLHTSLFSCTEDVGIHIEICAPVSVIVIALVLLVFAVFSRSLCFFPAALSTPPQWSICLCASPGSETKRRWWGCSDVTTFVFEWKRFRLDPSGVGRAQTGGIFVGREGDLNRRLI